MATFTLKRFQFFCKPIRKMTKNKCRIQAMFPDKFNWAETTVKARENILPPQRYKARKIFFHKDKKQMAKDYNLTSSFFLFGICSNRVNVRLCDCMWGCEGLPQVSANPSLAPNCPKPCLTSELSVGDTQASSTYASRKWNTCTSS